MFLTGHSHFPLPGSSQQPFSSTCSLHSHYHSPGDWFSSGLPKFWLFLLSHHIFLKLVSSQHPLSSLCFFPATPISLESLEYGLLGWDTMESLLVDTNVLREHTCTFFIFRINVWRHLKILEAWRWRHNVPPKHKHLPTQDYKVSHTVWTTTTMFLVLCMVLPSHSFSMGLCFKSGVHKFCVLHHMQTILFSIYCRTISQELQPSICSVRTLQIIS